MCFQWIYFNNLFTGKGATKKSMDYKTSIPLNLILSECIFIVYCNICKLYLHGLHTKSLNLEILKNKVEKSGSKFQESP